MSEVQNTPAAVAPVETTTTSAAAPIDAPAVAERVINEPVVDTEASKTETAAADSTVAPTDAAVVAEEPVVAEKIVEPITEGQLAYKGPGLVSSLIASKKEFWLDDSAVTPQNLDLYLRGEKPEISHHVVAWASQTGKGLLFFNKKNETDRTHPHDILALYEATDLKKESPHSFSFKIGSHSHTFKATGDAERDGWYMSIEKSVEIGKASKEEILAREGYTAELEKLSMLNVRPPEYDQANILADKPAVPVVGALSKRSQSQPKKSTEGEAAVERTGSSEDETDKKQKSRSTSRGLLSRLQGKKEEHAEKKEEEKVVDETTKPETEITEPVLASTEAAPVLAGGAAAEVPVVAESRETETPVVAETKANKRNSIFGRVSSTWGSMKSPAKEKDLKEVELKPETPATDAGVVSENPPVLPETGSTEPAAVTALPVVAEPAVETKPEATTEAPAETPSKEKNNFLASLIKRGRSVSPNTTKKTANKEEVPTVPAVPATETAEPVVKAEEPTPVAEPVVVADTTEPTEKVEETKTETNADKRQSMLGSLGRRASKALNRMQAPKKETTPAVATTGATTEEEVVEAKPVEETPVVATESKATDAQPTTIGDVVPEAVSTGQPQHTTPAVSASA